jgi:hypothetical protein
MLAERFLTRRFDQIATSAASSTVGACADLAALEAAMSEKDPSVKPLSRRILDLQSHDGTEGAAALELMPMVAQTVRIVLTHTPFISLVRRELPSWEIKIPFTLKKSPNSRASPASRSFRWLDPG